MTIIGPEDLIIKITLASVSNLLSEISIMNIAEDQSYQRCRGFFSKLVLFQNVIKNVERR